MATFNPATGIRDYLGNIIDGSYNLIGTKTSYCVTCANGDSFRIAGVQPGPSRLLAIVTSCGDLQMAYVPITADPPAATATLTPSVNTSLLLMGGPTNRVNYVYIPKDETTLHFYCKRAGTFWAAFLNCPDQMNDDPTP